MELSQGSRLANRFKVVAALEQGLFGLTFLAADAARGDNLVVLKALPPGLSAENRETLRKRIALAQRVNSPHLARVYELVDEADLFAISYQHHSGPSCQELAETEQLESADFVRLLHDLASALRTLSAHGVNACLPQAHNLVRDENGRFILTDWALPLMGMQIESTRWKDFAAPEYLTHNKFSEQSEVFVFGTFAFELLRHVRAWHDSEVASGVFRLIENCRQADPQARYPSLEFMQQEIAWLHHRCETKLLCSSSTFLTAMFVFLSVVLFAVTSQLPINW